VNKLLSQQHKIVTSACTLSASGALVFNAFPFFLSNIADQFQFNNEQLGFLGSSYLAGFALVALIAPLWIPRVPWRPMGLSGFCCILAAYILLGTVTADKVYYAMSILGVGSGILFTIALGVLAASRDPDRTFGIKIAVEMIGASVLLFTLTHLVISRFAYPGFLFGGLIFFAMTAIGLYWLPQNMSSGSPSPTEQSTDSATKQKLTGVIMACGALFIQFATFSGLWGFMERIGSEANINGQTLGSILSISLVFGLGGAVLCAVIGNKLGSRMSILSAMLLTILSITLLLISQSVIIFSIAACSVNALLQFLCATQMGLITRLDLNGKFTVMIAFILAAGGATGPGILGIIIETKGLSIGYILAIFATLIAMALTHVATRDSSQSAEGY
jgi:predicted MFS family arabinose efflux permease